MFEKSSRIHNEAFIPVFQKFQEMKKDDIAMWFIIGNHDIYSADKNNSIIEAFEPFGAVVKDRSVWDKFEFFGYTKSENDLTKEPVAPFLFTHLAIADFKFDNNYHVNEKIAFKRSLFKEYQSVFSGHFHRHQHKDNIIYVGSPYQLTINEKDTPKGFIVLNSETGEWSFELYNKAPEFIKISVEDIKNLKDFDFKNKFVHIKIDRKLDEFLKLKYILYEKGAIDVVPDFESISAEILTNEENQSEIDMTMSIPDVIRDFINNIENENVDKKKLLKIFEKVEKEAM